MSHSNSAQSETGFNITIPAAMALDIKAAIGVGSRIIERYVDPKIHHFILQTLNNALVKQQRAEILESMGEVYEGSDEEAEAVKRTLTPAEVGRMYRGI
jgi:hypothetical protein